MALTGAQLVDEVQAIIGRESDQVLADNTRVVRWLNEAQKTIAEECPNLDCLQFTNTASIDTTEIILYPVNEITIGHCSTEEAVCYLTDVYYLDGNESRKLEFIHPDVFDDEYPDPTHSDIPKSKPTHWTMQADLSGGYVKMMPMCLTAYCDKDLKFVGTFYPRDFTTEDSSVGGIKGADNALIAYGVWKSWAALGDTEEEIKWQSKFNGELERMQTQSSRFHQWDGNIFYTDYE